MQSLKWQTSKREWTTQNFKLKVLIGKWQTFARSQNYEDSSGSLGRNKLIERNDAEKLDTVFEKLTIPKVWWCGEVIFWGHKDWIKIHKRIML